MKRWLVTLLAMSVAVCLAADVKDKVSKKGDVPVFDTETGLEVGKAKFEATEDHLIVDLYITDGEPLVTFHVSVTTTPDVIELRPHMQLRATDEKGRTHETIIYGISGKYESFEATLDAHTWVAGPVTLAPKTK